MSRDIPGAVAVEGREFFYVETLPKEGFDEVLDGALASPSHLPLPESGGVLEERVKIILEGGRTSLLGSSYKCDLAGWRRMLVAFCDEGRRRWGVVVGQKLVLSDGVELALCECDVVFDR